MPNPKNASRGTQSSSSKSTPAPKPTWTRPERPPLQSSMLQNTKLNLHKPSRPSKRGQR